MLPPPDRSRLDSQARAVIDAEFLNPITYAVTISKISKTDSIQPHSNLGAGLDVP